jgi:hypothetical protein
MTPILLIDGNNLGHVLGYIDKASGHYDSASLLSRLDGVARYLIAQGQGVRMILFLDDAYAAERLGGWHVQVASVPSGNADVAIRTYAQAHADQPQTLVSADQALCGDVVVWGAVCLSPEAFVARYLIPARRAGFCSQRNEAELKRDQPPSILERHEEKPPGGTRPSPFPPDDQGESDRQRQIAALRQAAASLRGEPVPTPEIYRLELNLWTDAAELALYLAEEHLCPEHSDLTEPTEMIVAIRDHCSGQPRYFTSGRLINRIFRLFLCRPERSLSLDELAQLAKTRRRKIRAAIGKHGQQLGIVVAW